MIFAVIFLSIFLTQKGDCALLKKVMRDDFSPGVYYCSCCSVNHHPDSEIRMSSLFETFFRGDHSFLKTLLKSWAFEFTVQDYSARG